MTFHLTHVRAQQHIVDLQRQADNRRAAMTNTGPAKPRRASARRRWIVLSLVTGGRRG